MAITIHPKFDGERGSDGENAQGQVDYLVRDTSKAASFNEVKAAFAAQAPGSNGDLVLDHVEVTKELGGGMWEGTAHYKPAGKKEKEPGERVAISFRTTGGTQKITQALEHIGDYAPPGETAPNHHGAINVTEDGPEGVEIGFGGFDFEERWVFAEADITPAYARMLRDLSWRMNDVPFRTFEPGEVLFQGADGSNRQSDGAYDLTFKFSVQKNATNLVVDGITIPEKRGHDYLWFEYAKEEDTDAKRTTHRPIAAHLEGVYYTEDLSKLGIGS